MTDSPIAYPDALEIQPLDEPPNCTVTVPGSKSITNRALILASLVSKGIDSVLTGAPRCTDSEVMIDCLRTLGYEVETDWEAATPMVRVNALDDHFAIPRESGRGRPDLMELYVGDSGTTMRFITALVSRGYGPYRIDGSARMRERPIEDLLAALRQLGVNAYSERGNGCPPVMVKNNEKEGIAGGHATLKGNISSQFLTALLMVAPDAASDVCLDVSSSVVSWPYVAMTVEMMRRLDYRIHVEAGPTVRFNIPAPQHVWGLHPMDIEPDASAASYIFAAAAIAGGRLTVLNIPENSLQGDVRFVDMLADMGCRVERCSSGITVHGRPVHGLDVDMNDISDTVMTLAAVACFAEGPTTIRNVAHIRHKETDRITALATELRKVGAEVEEYPDGLKITPRPLHGAVIETYNDHRMAMSMALIGLKVPGIVIKNPGCVAKTYPRFWEDLERLRGD